MPTVIGHTEDGRDILRHEPHEGCQYRCVTCGDWLRGPYEVRGHWALCGTGHNVFVDLRGRAFHQTVEGLHEREWDVAVRDDDGE